MLIWNSELVQREHPHGSAVNCRCLLCGPVSRQVPLVRFDRVELDEQPDRGYPRRGICRHCVERSINAINQRTVEAGIVRIGGSYNCSHCGQRSDPTVWFSLATTQEQYICSSCLVAALHQMNECLLC